MLPVAVHRGEQVGRHRIEGVPEPGDERCADAPAGALDHGDPEVAELALGGQLLGRLGRVGVVDDEQLEVDAHRVELVAGPGHLGEDERDAAVLVARRRDHDEGRVIDRWLRGGGRFCCHRIDLATLRAAAQRRSRTASGADVKLPARVPLAPAAPSMPRADQRSVTSSPAAGGPTAPIASK